MSTPWKISLGDSPIVATAIHAGHDLRPDVSRWMAVGNKRRAREESPYTDSWTEMALNRIVVQASRFELDLDRPRGSAVYLKSGDAWGIPVWKAPPPDALIEDSRALYDTFHEHVAEVLQELIEQHGRIVVLDLQTYCHRRAGPTQRPAPSSMNPDINVGTGAVDPAIWGRLVKRLLRDLRRAEVDRHQLDVRENVYTRGGHFSAWVNQIFGESACAITLSMKKTFMDEWTGKLDYHAHRNLGLALRSAIPGLLESLR
jgi:N-formylglutamate deformylase